MCNTPYATGATGASILVPSSRTVLVPSVEYLTELTLLHTTYLPSYLNTLSLHLLRMQWQAIFGSIRGSCFFKRVPPIGPDQIAARIRRKRGNEKTLPVLYLTLPIIVLVTLIIPSPSLREQSIIVERPSLCTTDYLITLPL